MREENKNMKAFLEDNGFPTAIPKYFFTGSMRGTWRIYVKNRKWSPELAEKFNALGFTDPWNKPLTQFSGNGGSFQIFARHSMNFGERHGDPDYIADMPKEEPTEEKTYLCHLLTWFGNSNERLILIIKAKSEAYAYRKANNYVATDPRLSHLRGYGESDWDIDEMGESSEVTEIIHLER